MWSYSKKGKTTKNKKQKTKTCVPARPGSPSSWGGDTKPSLHTLIFYGKPKQNVLSWSRHNTIPWTWWLTNSKHLFPTVLGAQKSKLKVLANLEPHESPLPGSDGPFSLCPHMTEGAELSGDPFIRHRSQPWGLHPCDPVTSQYPTSKYHHIGS